MFSKKNKKKGFTLIEMLIVIVIIGILAAALIPRLSSARGRANDVARKADLAQTAAGLVSYQIDKGSFLECATANGCPLTDIYTGLISAGMNSIPTDPQSNKAYSGLNTTFSNGQYGYTSVSKGGILNNGFVLMAGAETEGGANRVIGGSAPVITKNTDYNNIILCKTITQGSTNNNINGVCTYRKGEDVLRYIYLY